ncbi:hypothetical protein FT663_01945 [Candidozyma haemuli var. vulneris]|uniref:Exocyst complex component Sec3 PIP2-binding N-terminal domain-containing protein n=1 Tax=Candidozyma haemuli TaxID=45357 RepID=A0A2V1ATK8_9ASCO|nr:hypothetical protein CXQ85_000397 [[Candida] haemuloni]KAF3987291.1 hypothetical protein FT662_04082 [[Candida] haemuloni var. vulneris]KAF3993355.1 hypothetical protein FT663_01945 [[Candida] haemuloni var. vulneris]PVH21420.1 hypothetical protein CXQ85_000397 [[Candida] haemuloni]
MNFHSLSPRRRKQQQQQQQQQAPPQGRPLQKNPRNMMPMNAPQKAPPPRMPVDPRKMIVDQIIRDCYSKIIVSEGRNVPEIRYNTHLNIREYSSYPQSPPPSDIPPSQVGAIKNRILVVATKSSGRVLLQKGKYNDVKHIYQIGRTWDLDELQGITRTGPDSLVLQLNKNYYWKSGEGPDRMMKFVHHLSQIYTKFTGRYPVLNGISLQELNLPAVGQPPSQASSSSLPTSKPSLSQQPTAQSANTTADMSSQSYDPSSLYKGLDFTANGKLPSKPMVVMDVDRPGSKTSLVDASSMVTGETGARTEKSVRSSHPYSQFSQSQSGDVSNDPNETADSHSFVFSPSEEKPKLQEEQAQMPSISEYARKNGGASSPLRNYKPDSAAQGRRDATEPIEQSAAFGDELKEQLEGNETQESLNFQFKVPTDTSQAPQRVVTPPPADDGIEEVYEEVTPEQPRKYRMPSIPGGFPAEEAPREAHEDEIETSRAVSESTNVPDNGINSSIKEIEDFMESQLTTSSSRKASAVPKPQPIRDDNESELSYDDQSGIDSLKSPMLDGLDTPLTETQSHKGDSKVLVDPEIEDMLDEVGYDVLDNSETFVKKLNTELNQIKRRNIEELTSLDFGKDSLSNEVENASGEVENLIGIFKKMEVGFDLLAPRINLLENNSQGLQVKSINKKILFNDLNEILNKVRVNPADLQLISTYHDFENLHSIPTLERKLAGLYEALGAIGSSNAGDDLSSMQALKQFQEKYQNTSAVFVQHFKEFLEQELVVTINGLTKDITNLFPRNLLVSFKVFLAYTGITSFVKCVSEKEMRLISENSNGYLANFLDRYLSERLKHLQAAANETVSKRVSGGVETVSALRKSKSSRFGSQRLIHRLGGHSDEQEKKKELTQTIQSNSKSLGDPKIIMRMVHETQELILVIQFFVGTIFHHCSVEDFTDFIKTNSFKDRVELFDNPDLESVNYKTSSNDLLRSMTTIFGNYISRLIKRLTPKEMILPQLLVELTRLIKNSGEKDQDFVCFSFLTKISDRYKTMWKRFITGQVDLLNKSDVRARVGVLPAIKNLNEIIFTTESSLQEAGGHRDTAALTEVEDMVKESYNELTAAAVELFERDDPLLKSNAHDEKERAHRNVSILQNIFSVTSQLSDLRTQNTQHMKKELDVVFGQTQKHYFDYLLHKNIGKIIDFNNAVENRDGTSKHKKDDKIFIKSIVSSYTSKELQQKVSDIHRKLEKHFITNEDMFEQELVKKLWTDMEYEFITIFQKFDREIRSVDRDFEFNITTTEIRRLFASV